VALFSQACQHLSYEGKLTFLVYIAWDNDLDPPALKDIEEMAKVGFWGKGPEGQTIPYHRGRRIRERLR
jgi:hypothetical protein